MKEYTTITVENSKQQVIELINFLNDIKKFNSEIISYNLGVVRFYGITKDDSNREISKNPTIFSDWNLFLELITNIEQIYEIELLIDNDKKNIQRYSNEIDAYKNNYICLEYFDGGFWEITSKDNLLIGYLAEKYPPCSHTI
ncbi:hypothetical protein [Chryseobacterium fistulae]|uniref:Uncharacterized protein n=1 Tax=Chryseobacterium fistulae TaxID=2675058 RepID=A0A6N4XVU7_9FLAO|nr:hypothetical protein [Chryseobacterium fistulae]CAA7389498.1 hypothetical protein CHRY9393_02156 [Chryseobacterium fistulae]